MENTWLSWAKRLQSVASTGLHYSRDEYDKERYDEVAAIANEMLSALGNVPIARIQDLVSDFAKGYATPKVDVRGAIIEGDKILLVREVSDGLWTLPGGFADVGLSPGENIVKEIWEEATLRVEATAVYGLRHKAKHGYDPDVRDFYKIFFICEHAEPSQPRPGPEITEVDFFGLDELPALSTDRVLEKDIVAAFAFKNDSRSIALFD
ncbi:MAG: NUDIX hydrolase [Gammaproteobacteria bacterium]|nr:NUDIX hydrolase [Gammaproteobacteria bacterium]